MNELDELRAEVVGAYSDLLEQLDDSEARVRRELTARSLRQFTAAQYFVVVCGEFSRGKSSLLNALAGRPDVFPVDIGPTTRAISVLKWGAEERVLVYSIAGQDSAGGAAVGDVVPLARVADYATEERNSGSAQNVAQIEISAPIPLLETGLVLIDTPGLGSLHAVQGVATRSLLPNADAVIFAVSVTEPLSLMEVEFVKDAMKLCPTVITAVTMIDRVVDADAILGETRARIARASGENPDDLAVIGVSSMRWNRAERISDPELRSASGIGELERLLWNGLARTSGRARITRALGNLSACLDEAAAPVANELAALGTQVGQMRAWQEIQEALERIEALLWADSPWRVDLAAEMNIAGRAVTRRLEDDFVAISADFHAMVRSEQAVRHPDDLVQELTERVVDTVNAAEQELTRRTSEAFERIHGDAAIPGAANSAFPAFRLGDAAEVLSPGIGPSLQVTPFSQSAFGAAVGPLVGGSLGGIAGNLAGWRRGFAQARADKLAQLGVLVDELITSSRQQARERIQDAVAYATRSMIAAVSDELAASRESLEESARCVGGASKHAEAERAERTAELRRLDYQFTVLRQRVLELEERTRRLGSRSGTE
jgi:Dynamin family